MKYELIIDDIDHQGRGIGHINGKTIFIPNALVGECVEVEVTKNKKNYMEGKVINYIKTSSLRIKPICPYFDKCGGCDLMHIPYEEQLKYKKNKVISIMKKFAHIDKDIVNDIISCEQTLGYRNKITFQVKEKLGLFERKSYQLISVDKCLLVPDEVNNLINILNEYDLSKINSIVIRYTNLKQIMVVFTLKEDIPNNELVSKLEKHVTSVYKNLNTDYYKIYGQDYVTDTILDYKFNIYPSAFFQVNRYQIVKLYDVILKYAELTGKEKVLDLYCGTGTIGTYLSKYAKEVLGVEINELAIKNANENKRINNIDNITFVNGNVSKVINNLDYKPDLIIVDPPRVGLDKNTINYILSKKTDKVIYVSCNPITLARDIKLMDEYDVEKITPVDMFPNTSHVECVCILERR